MRYLAGMIDLCNLALRVSCSEYTVCHLYQNRTIIFYYALLYKCNGLIFISHNRFHEMNWHLQRVALIKALRETVRVLNFNWFGLGSDILMAVH